jgi:uncharacterized membrane protein
MGELMVSEFVIIAVIMVSAVLAAIAQYIFKRNLNAFKFNINGIWSLAKNRAIILGLIVYAVSLVVYLGALRYGDLSFVYPTFASVFIFVLLISKFKLNERISLHRALGVALVIVGIAIVAVTY